MKTSRDLSSASWMLAGYAPETWRDLIGVDTGVIVPSETVPVPASVPASVQQLLLESGAIPAWTHGLKSREAEWVENRTWIYSTRLPRSWFEGGSVRRLRCAGLDHSGWVCFNGALVSRFENGFVEHVFDLSAIPLRD